MKYKIERTDTADSLIRKIILYVAEQFDAATALAKLDELEKNIMLLSTEPYLGEAPRYPLLRKQGYRVLILKKDLVFYKINEKTKTITIYAVVDHRQDYISILRGL